MTPGQRTRVAESGREPTKVVMERQVSIPVAMLTWVVMPNLTRPLYAWLYRGHEETT
jgi:antibiotic biosynthesis monooxygenase (ABM) superfamily enzyme